MLSNPSPRASNAAASSADNLKSGGVVGQVVVSAFDALVATGVGVGGAGEDRLPGPVGEGSPAGVAIEGSPAGAVGGDAAREDSPAGAAGGAASEGLPAGAAGGAASEGSP